jgi:hypothetical protein
MRFQLSTILAVASATLAIAKSYPDHVSPRPKVSCHPKTPHRPPPNPPPRNKVCYVKSHNDSLTDDSPYILDALHTCNNGGHVVFKEGLKYTIGTALDLTFLKHIDIGMNPRLFPEYLKLTIESRYPIIHSIYKRHYILASQLVQIRLPERDFVLQARWHRREYLRRRNSGRQWPSLV